QEKRLELYSAYYYFTLRLWRVLHGVGGKERVFLVSGETRCDDDGRPDPSPAVAGVTAPDPAEGAVKSASRAVDAAVVMFLINQQYVQRTPNRVCVKEILKDVKARIRHLKVRPALVGLVRSEVETGQSQALVEVLERLLRSVFRQHSHQAIWAGVFIPGNVERILAVRRHATMALISSLMTVMGFLNMGRTCGLGLKQTVHSFCCFHWFHRSFRQKCTFVLAAAPSVLVDTRKKTTNEGPA
uniref:Uncharacterized protein n=1 Tax=Denticeps clupeoides TaxID=299321 RepID=A0AAY4EQL1_9TELE